MAEQTHPFRPLRESSKRWCSFDDQVGHILAIIVTLSVSIHEFSSSTIRQRQLHRPCRSLRRRPTTRTTRFMPQNHLSNIRRRICQRRRTLTRRPPILIREIPLRSTPFPTTPPTTTTTSRRPRSQTRALRRHAHACDITPQRARAVVMPVTLIHHDR